MPAKRKSIHVFTDFLSKSWLSPINQRQKFTEFEAWIYCIYVADEDGVCSKSLKELASEWKWSKSKVKRFIEALEKGKYVKIETNGVTKFRILAYSLWTTGEKEPPRFVKEAREICDHMKSLMKKGGYTEKRRKMIAAKLNSSTKDTPVTVEGIKMMISHYHRLWKDDEKMSEYIRFETLLGEKFIAYLEEAAVSKNKGKNLQKGSFFKDNKTHQ